MSKKDRPPIVRFAFDLPADLHRDLKIESYLAKESMTAYILRAVVARMSREKLLIKHIDRPISED